MRYTLFLFILFIKPVAPEVSMVNYTEPASPVWMSSIPCPPDLQPDSIFTVVSYNIEFGLKFEEAAQELATYPLHNADIILLQEMDEHATMYLAEQLKYNYLYFPMNNHPKYNKKFGNAILSKWPISLPEKIILPHQHPLNKLKRGITGATIEYGNARIKTYSLHLETPLLRRTKRIQQLQKAMDHINLSVSDEHVVFGGDFNSATRSDVQQMVQVCRRNELNWSTQGIGPTYRRFGVIRPTLDHIFTRGFDQVASGKSTEAEASDHSPIWTKLKIIKS